MFTVRILGLNDKHYHQGRYSTKAEAELEAAKWPSLFEAHVIPSSLAKALPDVQLSQPAK